MIRTHRAAALAAVLMLAGCAGLPVDEGHDAVSQLGAARGVDLPGIDTPPPPLPATIDAQAAVRIALTRNPALRASLASIGFGAAAVYEAGRIANPVLDLSLLDSNSPGGSRRETLGIVFAFTDLLTLPARGRIAQADFVALQHEVSAKAMDTALAARYAWLDYAAALELAALQRQVAEAGIVSAELAERFRRAGNLTPRELAEQKAATAMLRADAIAAEARVAEARAKFAVALGISSGGDWQLEGGLAEPTAATPALLPLLDAAVDTRLDLAAARMRADAKAARAGVENWSRWLTGIEFGAEREREPDGEQLEGPRASLTLPVFDTGRGRVARARAELAQAVAEVRRIELDIDNGLRLAQAQLDAARRRALTFRDTLLPARRRAVAEASAQYNFMLIGVFELLEVKRQEIEATQDYVVSVTDFWRARLALARAAGRMLPVPDTRPLRLTGDDSAHGTHEHQMRDRGDHAGHDDHETHTPEPERGERDTTDHRHHDEADKKPGPKHDHGREQ